MLKNALTFTKPKLDFQSSFTLKSYFSTSPTTYLNIPDKKYVFDNQFLDARSKLPNTEIFTLILNWPFDYKSLYDIYKRSSYSCMADGAANFFYAQSHVLKGSDIIIPNAVIGDLDSAEKKALDFFDGKGTQVKKYATQDNSDLEKCMIFIDEWFNEPDRIKQDVNYKLVVAGGLGGRFDHCMNNISVVHKYQEIYSKKHPNFNIVLIDNNSIATCLLPGTNIYKRALNYECAYGCGFFPLQNDEAKATTRGFKWNLDKHSGPLRFGEFVSSSNEMVQNEVMIKTEKTLFFTTTSHLHENYKRVKGDLTFGINTSNLL